MKIIPVNFDKLERVYHLADIHIRLFKRHNEYREVFDNLYKDIASRDTGNSAILIAGDILHAKLDMSPEMISLTADFFRNLADIAPTLVTDGNHDLNLSNLHRMRSLSPIIGNMKHENLHYLCDSGVYQVADTQFAVFSITDPPDMWPTADELDSDVKIATYHGPVFGAKTDTNYIVTSRHVVETQFYGFDIAMLGDIHKVQNICNKDPIIRYCGSLIQQNHGETLEGHGYTLWNIPNKTYEHVEIKNDVGYVTIRVAKDELKTFQVPDGLPKNLRLRVFYSDLNNSDIKRVVNKVKKKYNIIHLTVNPERRGGPGVPHHSPQIEVGDLNNINVQNTLITEYLEANRPNLSEKTVQEVLNVNNQINGKIQYHDQSRNIHWKPIYFKFSNLFSYGEDNYIDFTTLEGANGIFAPNASGKSSSMESMIFALFDKTPRAFRGDHIMNTRKKTFECELSFLVNGEKYFISRVGKKHKNGTVRVDVEFWKEKSDGTIVNLNGDDRFGTNANIRSVVGTYEDFILTTLSGQNGSSLFIDKSNTERKNLLNQFMGLNIFESLYQAANEDIKQIQGVLKKFNREDYTDEMNELQDEIEDIRLQLDEVQTESDELERALENNQSEIEALSSQKINVPVSTYDIKSLESQIEKQMVRKSAIEDNIEILKSNRTVAYSKLETARAKIAEYDPEDLKSGYELYQEHSMHLSQHVAEHKMLLGQLENIEDTIEQISGFKYNPNCDVCLENNKSKIEQIEKLEQKAGSLREDITDVARWISIDEDGLEKHSDSVEKYKSYTSVKNNLENLEIELSGVINDIDRYENNIDSIVAEINEKKRNIKQSEDYVDSIKKNTTIEEKIDILRVERNGIKRKFTESNAKKVDLHSSLKVGQSKLESIVDRLEDINKMEKEYEAYGYYLETVSRDGLPYYLISKTIPMIEDEINSILSQIVPFTIALDVDGKNFGGRIVYDPEKSWPLENSSGMERFISSLAIRVALLRASNLPKSNFLIIDEGMGSLDVEYLHGMQMMFDLLKTQFDFLVIISHLDNIRDMVDDVIEITSVNGYSHINTQM